MHAINSFTQLSLQIELTHSVMQQSVGRAINQHLTARNWLIGYYIKEFEQNKTVKTVLNMVKSYCPRFRKKYK